MATLRDGRRDRLARSRGGLSPAADYTRGPDFDAITIRRRRCRRRRKPISVITLTTDFGFDSTYVAAMKGAILRSNPAAALLDLSHGVPAQDVASAAFYLLETLPQFPRESTHLVVVDPGVGTDRRLLTIAFPFGRVVCPDNGVWTWLPGADFAVVHELAIPEARRSGASATFHGRDLLGPAAAELSLGSTAPIGKLIKDWARLPFPAPRRTGAGWKAEILALDTFGNGITNLRWEEIAGEGAFAVEVAGQRIEKVVRTYGEANPGELILLNSSSGWLEIAEAQGNAARTLGLRRGMPTAVMIDSK